MKSQGTKTIRVHFCGMSEAYRLADFLVDLGRFDESIEVCSPTRADFLFADHTPRSIRAMLSLPDTGQIRILLAKEAVSPDFNLFDYAISFDASIQSFRHFRPHTLLSFASDFRIGDINSGLNGTSKSFVQRKRFCDFIYGNHRGHSMRATILNELTQRFSGIESMGNFLNNQPSKQNVASEPGNAPSWRHEKIRIQTNSLFSISAENATFPGYTTEKLLHPLAAGSIPLYWGNSLVGSEFNINRFIQVPDGEFDRLAERVEAAARSEESWNEIARQPALTAIQEANFEENRVRLVEWFSRFLRLPHSDLQIRPRGWYPDWYTGSVKVAYFAQLFSLARVQGFLRTASNGHRA